MSHFAKIDTNNIVTEVLVGDNTLPNEGYDFIVKTFGGTWVQTSYNTHGGVHTFGGTPLRKNYAGIGHTYDPVLDAFYEPQPYPSWILNKITCVWEAPVAKPTENGPYTWDEENQTWV